MNLEISKIADRIKQIMSDARESAAAELNGRLLKTYCEIGCIIVENEQKGSEKAEYGSRLLLELSRQLTAELGRGFSRSNLQNMRNFYLAYLNLPDASGKLNWSHYSELVNIADTRERSFYEQECINSRWSVRDRRMWNV